MKVYELMEALSECEAGAEVTVSHTMTIKELLSEEVIGNENNDVLYSMSHSVCDVENDNGVVRLYLHE